MGSDLKIPGKKQNLGDGFTVVRSLPTSKCRSVGHFVFMDHMGPVELKSDSKLDVRPHPHIGLSTVTYLFEGQGWHRDSLGTDMVIHPGDINWMTAGKGIVHSERTPDEVLKEQGKLHGIQIWVALPKEYESCQPEFVHYPKAALPQSKLGRKLEVKVLIGEWRNLKSPVKSHTRLLFADIFCLENTAETLSFDEEQVALYCVQGAFDINGVRAEVGDLIVLDNPSNNDIQFQEGSRCIVVGGAPLAEPRHMWWNFVSSDKGKIREAADLWSQQKMGKVPGEDEWIPLPQQPLP